MNDSESDNSADKDNITSDLHYNAASAKQVLSSVY